MPVKFETIKSGDLLYEVQTRGLGNTRLSAQAAYTVRVLSIDHDNFHAMVSWNGNPPKKVRASEFRRYCRTPPEWLHNGLDGPSCGLCFARKSDGHKLDCDHPKAARAREKLYEERRKAQQTEMM